MLESIGKIVTEAAAAPNDDAAMLPDLMIAAKLAPPRPPTPKSIYRLKMSRNIEITKFRS